MCTNVFPGDEIWGLLTDIQRHYGAASSSGNEATLHFFNAPNAGKRWPVRLVANVGIKGIRRFTLGRAVAVLLSEDCYTRARGCEELANTADNDYWKKFWLDLAQHWRQIARKLEANGRLPPHVRITWNFSQPGKWPKR